MSFHRAAIQLVQLLRGLLVVREFGKRLRPVIIPAFLTAGSFFHHEHRAGREFADVFVDRQRRWRIAEPQKKVHRHRIHLRPRVVRRQDGPDFRAEIQLAISDPVIDQLDAHRVARDDQPPLFHVPDCHAEHAVQVIENVEAPFLVAVDDDLRVRLGAEPVAGTFEFGTQFPVVINLAVKNDPHGLFRIGHRLVAAGQVNDRKPPETKAERAVKKITLVVRAAMKNRLRHPADRVLIHRFVAGDFNLSANAAHFNG